MTLSFPLQFATNATVVSSGVNFTEAQSHRYKTDRAAFFRDEAVYRTTYIRRRLGYTNNAVRLL